MIYLETELLTFCRTSLCEILDAGYYSNAL